MANRTVRDANTVKGTNPQFLVEKIIRHRIYDSKFWKEECFALSSELLVDKGMELKFIGGIYAGNVKPTPFLCLLLKMLQLQPEKEIVMEFIMQDDFKYIRALGAIYLRMVFPSIEIYKYLEPLFNDFRKLRVMNNMGRYELIHMDEFVDKLLREDRVFDLQMPRLQKRQALEELGALEEYKSALDEDLDKISDDESDTDKNDAKKIKPSLISTRRSRSREREPDLEREKKYRDAEYTKEKRREKEREERKRRDKSPNRDHDREHRRHRSKSRDRDERRDRDDRDRRDRDKDRRDKDRDRGRDREHKDRGKDKEKDRRKTQTTSEREIDEANAMRAQLGLAPLER